ncbi:MULTISPECIES: hypothetical protein [Rhodococcus]|uniref:hypothetical protein n=1 Tax=Rhodococcus TaxID=1827 RepID=UPI0012691394|nr:MULTISPECIES: hypothetical protein [Rhodococcus]
MSDSWEDHPAVASALAVVRNRTDDVEVSWEPYLLVVRDTIAAVGVRNSESRSVALVNHVDGRWCTPPLVTTVMLPLQAPARTFRPSFIQRLSVKQAGSPSADGRPPEVAWTVLAGFLAADVRSGVTQSSIDEYEADVADDGFILAVLRARWREKLAMIAIMNDGRHIPCIHPSLR